jgi:predicted helicase
MENYTKFIHDNPVAMLSTYIAAVNKNKTTPEIAEIAKLYSEVESYISMLELERTMLLGKLT